MAYTNGLSWGKPGGVVGKSTGAAPYTDGSVQITQADIDADSDKLIRIPVTGVYQIALTSLAKTSQLADGASGTTVAKAYYYGMNSVGEVGTPLEQKADSLHIMNLMLSSDVGSTSSGDLTAAKTYTDTSGVQFSTCDDAGATLGLGAEATAICQNLQISQDNNSLLLPNEAPINTAGYWTDLIYLGGYFQELVVAFDYGSWTSSGRFNVLCNRIYF
tara:strand:- start:739 stop:1389 length:651 start_codon:yes stop_codon:yes gene_type:complete